MTTKPPIHALIQGSILIFCGFADDWEKCEFLWTPAIKVTWPKKYGRTIIWAYTIGISWGSWSAYIGVAKVRTKKTKNT